MFPDSLLHVDDLLTGRLNSFRLATSEYFRIEGCVGSRRMLMVDFSPDGHWGNLSKHRRQPAAVFTCGTTRWSMNMISQCIFPAELIGQIFYHTDPPDIVRWRTESLLHTASSDLVYLRPSLAGFKVVPRPHLRSLALENIVCRRALPSSTWTISYSIQCIT